LCQHWETCSTLSKGWLTLFDDGLQTLTLKLEGSQAYLVLGKFGLGSRGGKAQQWITDFHPITVAYKNFANDTALQMLDVMDQAGRYYLSSGDSNLTYLGYPCSVDGCSQQKNSEEN